MVGGSHGLVAGRAGFWGALITRFLRRQPQPPGSRAPNLHVRRKRSSIITDFCLHVTDVYVPTIRLNFNDLFCFLILMKKKRPILQTLESRFLGSHFFKPPNNLVSAPQSKTVILQLVSQIKRFCKPIFIILGNSKQLEFHCTFYFYRCYTR